MSINQEQLENLDVIARALSSIDETLKAILQQTADKSPNYRFQFDEYPDFDWASIGAEPIRRDEYGVTQVRWGGYANWNRRFAPAKSGRKPSIWFSRAAAAEDADTGAEWYTLVTFRDLAGPEPLPAGAVKTQAQPDPPPPPSPANPGNGRPVQDAPPAQDESMFDPETAVLEAHNETVFYGRLSTLVNTRGYHLDTDQVQKTAEMIRAGWPFTDQGKRAMLKAVLTYLKKRGEIEGRGEPMRDAHNRAKSDAVGEFNRLVS